MIITLSEITKEAASLKLKTHNGGVVREDIHHFHDIFQDSMLFKVVTNNGEGCRILAALLADDTWAFSVCQLTKTQPIPNWWRATTCTGVEDNLYKLILDCTLDTPTIERLY